MELRYDVTPGWALYAYEADHVPAVGDDVVVRHSTFSVVSRTWYVLNGSEMVVLDVGAAWAKSSSAQVRATLEDDGFRVPPT